MAEKFSLDLKQDPKVIAGTRIFDAPRALVFSAWTEPRHLAHWFGPNGFSLTTHSFDFRPGGIWRFVMHGPDGRDYQNRITFDEISPPERIAYHHGGGDDVEPVEFKTVVTFEDLGGKTKLTMRGIFPSAEARARVIREYGADKGQVETLARLADYVARWSNKTTSADAAGGPIELEFSSNGSHALLPSAVLILLEGAHRPLRERHAVRRRTS